MLNCFIRLATAHCAYLALTCGNLIEEYKRNTNMGILKVCSGFVYKYYRSDKYDEWKKNRR